MYQLARQALFLLPPETAHHLSLMAISGAARLGLLPTAGKTSAHKPLEVMGLRFPNGVGLAAGLDKNGDYFNALGALGFGFVEIGTVTPRPQQGNPRPRLFRVAQRQAIINRMGFNNLGVDHLVKQVAKRRYEGVLGINIGKNADTPMERAIEDYRHCLQKVYPCADYVTVNISSPNTPGLRDLQLGQNLQRLLAQLKDVQSGLADKHQRYVPLAVKIAPDMEADQLADLAALLIKNRIDGVIATNTTIARDGIENLPVAQQAGGLSGSPLRARATSVVTTLARHLDGAIPIIGVGGICSGADAVEKVRAGASLVQLYTGFIYGGPGLIKESVAALAATDS